VPGHALRDLDAPAVAGVISEAGGAEGVTADGGRDTGIFCSTPALTRAEAYVITRNQRAIARAPTA
jgi:hypothetical protein